MQNPPATHLSLPGTLAASSAVMQPGITMETATRTTSCSSPRRRCRPVAHPQADCTAAGESARRQCGGCGRGLGPQTMDVQHRHPAGVQQGKPLRAAILREARLRLTDCGRIGCCGHGGFAAAAVRILTPPPLLQGASRAALFLVCQQHPSTIAVAVLHVIMSSELLLFAGRERGAGWSAVHCAPRRGRQLVRIPP